MTKDEAKQLIALPIPTDRSDKLEIAESYLTNAITDIALLDQYDFNQQRIDFVLAAGSRRTVLGEGFLTDYTDVYGMTDIYYTTENPGERKIIMLSKSQFQTDYSSEDRTERPRVACMYTNAERTQLELEVFPTPDVDYTVFSFAKRAITRWDDIPAHGQSIIANWAARKVAEMLARAQGLGPKELNRAIVQGGSETFRGDRIAFDTQFQAHGRFGGPQPNSFDLTGSREE